VNLAQRTPLSSAYPTYDFSQLRRGIFGFTDILARGGIRVAAKKKTAAKQKGQAKVGKVMHEFKRGQLKSGGRAKVKNPKQAIAIGLSEARRAGADVPPQKKGAATKSGAKKAAAKKSSRKRS
jgi:Family of unknown function (DUF6496)